MFKKYKLNRAISRVVEDKLYEMALEEVENDILIKGAWARALSQSDGIDAKAKSIYLQYRVEAMKNEAQIMESVLEELSKEEKRQVIDKKTVNSSDLRGSRTKIVSDGNLKNDNKKLVTKKSIDEDASRNIAKIFLFIHVAFFIYLFLLITNF